MSDGAISAVHYPRDDKRPELNGALQGGAYLSQAQPPVSVYGDTGVQLTDEQRKGSIFC